jgi:hypothetical protein
MDTELEKKENREVKEHLEYCKKCEKPITGQRRQFCSVKCAKAFHSLKRYHKIKSTPVYKQRRRDYVRKVRKERKAAEIKKEETK